jgi:hypothetical protein
LTHTLCTACFATHLLRPALRVKVSRFADLLLRHHSSLSGDAGFIEDSEDRTFAEPELLHELSA